MFEFSFGSLAALIAYVVAIVVWLVRLEASAKSLDKEKADKELVLKCFSRLEALEKTVDGSDGLKADMKEIKIFMQELNVKLERLLVEKDR